MFERFFGPSIFGPWTSVLLEYAEPGAGERVLDLACATGIVARRVAPAVGDEGEVLGLDISPDMLDVARNRAAAEGLSIEWREGDAHELDLPDDSFDLVLCQQGIQFFPDPLAALEETERVLGAGGRLVLNVWKRLEHQPVYRAVLESEARHLDAEVADAAAPFMFGDSALRCGITSQSRAHDPRRKDERRVTFLPPCAGAKLRPIFRVHVDRTPEAPMNRHFIFRAAIPTIVAVFALAAPAAAQMEHGADHHWLPADAEGAMEALETSPRHGEWMITHLPDGDSVRSWVVYPERSEAAPVLVVVHEIYGLTHWVRAVADQAAADGFIAVAPDLLTMHDVPTTDVGEPQRDPAVEAIRSLDEDRVHRQIRAVAEEAMALPAAQSEYAITGFCWGGSATFQHATRFDDLMAAVVFYGGSPSEEELGRVNVPVLGHYGGDDERVNATIPRAEAALEHYHPNVYEGAGHGFVRQQSGRDGANHRATVQAWPMTVGFIRGALFGRSAR